jgi:hypothetical protein
MNFFQVQNKLFYSDKRKPAGYLDSEGDQNFVPFLINRWLTMYSKDTVNFTNETLNKYSTIFNDKQQTWRLYFNLIPRLKFSRIKYIKKPKREKTEEVENLELIAKNKCMSVRELKEYMELQSKLD